MPGSSHERLINLLRLAYKNENVGEATAALYAAARAARDTPFEDLLEEAKHASEPDVFIHRALQQLEEGADEDLSWIDEILRNLGLDVDPPPAPEPSLWSSREWEHQRTSWGSGQPFDIEVWVHRAGSGIRVQPARSTPNAWQWVRGETLSKLYGKPEEAMLAAEEWWRVLTRGAPFDLYTPKEN